MKHYSSRQVVNGAAVYIWNVRFSAYSGTYNVEGLKMSVAHFIDWATHVRANGHIVNVL